MKERGFTLIELLAVIVILAIIALIAVPIILNIIEDSKNSSNKRSIELYAKAIENAVGNYQVKNPQDKDITLEKIEDYIEYKGNKVECSTTEINEDGTVYLSGCKINGKEVEYTYGKEQEESKTIVRAATEEDKSLAGKIPSGNFDLGDEYIINLDGQHEYHFYVISTEEDKVNLIMSNNICSDGTLATAENTCVIPWASKADYNDNKNYGSLGNNNKGPMSAMNYLHEATKKWSNIENIQMNYTDEGNTGEYGYGSILTEQNITTITMKDGTTETARYENLKARLPKESEIAATGCTTSFGSCPVWMVNGLNAFTSKYPTGTKEDIEGIWGYWSLSSSSSNSSTARYVDFTGAADSFHVSGNSNRGLRPVITISKSDFS